MKGQLTFDLLPSAGDRVADEPLAEGAMLLRGFALSGVEGLASI